MARRAARVTMEDTAIVMEESEEMIQMDTHNVTSGRQNIVSLLNICVMTDLLDELLPTETEGITKEQDEEIMKAKQRQVTNMSYIIVMCIILCK